MCYTYTQQQDSLYITQHTKHDDSIRYMWYTIRRLICYTHTQQQDSLYITQHTKHDDSIFTCDNQQEDSYVAHIHNNKTLFILRRTPNKTTRFITRDMTQENPCVAHIHNHKTLSILRRENTFCIPCNMKSITCNKSSRLDLYSTQGTNQDDSIYYTWCFSCYMGYKNVLYGM